MLDRAIDALIVVAIFAGQAIVAVQGIVIFL
jgi:hypothetical protein